MFNIPAGNTNSSNFIFLKIEKAKKALSHLYGPEYQASEEVEIIRRHLEHHAKASGNQ